MKIVFGVVSLLVVLVIVLLVGKQQMHAMSALAPPGASSAPMNPAQASRQMQEQMSADVQKALQSGMDRNDAAERREGEGDK